MALLHPKFFHRHLQYILIGASIPVKYLCSLLLAKHFECLILGYLDVVLSCFLAVSGKFVSVLATKIVRTRTSEGTCHAIIFAFRYMYKGPWQFIDICMAIFLMCIYMGWNKQFFLLRNFCSNFFLFSFPGLKLVRRSGPLPKSGLLSSRARSPPWWPPPSPPNSTPPAPPSSWTPRPSSSPPCPPPSPLAWPPRPPPAESIFRWTDSWGGCP